MATEIINVTPSMDSGVRPARHDERADDVSLRQWVEGTPVYRSLPATDAGGWNVFGPGPADRGRDHRELSDDHPEFVAAGCGAVFLLGYEPVTAETSAAGGGRHITLVGLSEDGTRAMVRHGDEWRPTPDGLYPWPSAANAL